MRWLPLLSPTLLLGLPLSAAPQVPSARPLLLEARRPAFPGIGAEPSALRQRAVEVDLALVRDAAVAELGLELFPDAAVTARLERVEPAHGGGLVWVGTVVGEPGSSVFLALSEDVAAGSIRFDDRLFRLSYGGNGVHLLSELDESSFPSCGTDESYAVGSPSDAPDSPGDGAAPRSLVIDVMVVYSTVAKNQQGGANAMASLINLAVAETNQAYANSLVSQRLALVHTAEMVGYVEPASFGQILTDLEGKNDGKLDQVHALRDQHAADAVSMICNNGQYCGIANLMVFVSHGFEDDAFSVVNRGCATGYYSFGHELGHNFGSHHDPANAGTAAFPYAYGYRTPDNRYRTVMAYSPGTRVQYFSSPSVQFQGYVLGTAAQDNARCLNNTASTAAGWRVASVPPVLTVPSLAAGSPATLTVDDCTPGGEVFIAYSLTGPGPLLTSFGFAALSAPLHLFPARIANGSGRASLTTPIPAGTTGVPVWLQALDLVKGLFSNGVQRTIL